MENAWPWTINVPREAPVPGLNALILPSPKLPTSNESLKGPKLAWVAGGFAGLFGTRGAAGLVATVAVLACLFDLYTVHFVSVPYYTGLTTHLDSGFVASFHPARAVREMGLAAFSPACPSTDRLHWHSLFSPDFGQAAYPRWPTRSRL